MHLVGKTPDTSPRPYFRWNVQHRRKGSSNVFTLALPEATEDFPGKINLSRLFESNSEFILDWHFTWYNCNISDAYTKRSTNNATASLSRSWQHMPGQGHLDPGISHFTKGIFLHWSLLPPKHSIFCLPETRNCKWRMIHHSVSPQRI